MRTEILETHRLFLRPFEKEDALFAIGIWNDPEMWDSYSRTNTADAYDTPKPEAVLERIISTCSKKDDVVADFFLGGGTTAVVAKKLGRKFIGCDISAKACEVTVRKLENQG